MVATPFRFSPITPPVLIRPMAWILQALALIRKPSSSPWKPFLACEEERNFHRHILSTGECVYRNLRLPPPLENRYSPDTDSGLSGDS